MTGKLLEVGNNKIITNTIKLITIHNGLYPLLDVFRLISDLIPLCHYHRPLKIVTLLF